MAAATAGKEDANSVIYLLSRDAYRNVEVVVSENGPTFRSHELKQWAGERRITLRVTALYQQVANGLAQRTIRDIEAKMNMYPDFPGG